MASPQEPGHPPDLPPVAALSRPSEGPAPGRRSEHIVYIPYSKLADIFEKEGRNVLVPFEEYQRLWEAVQRLGTSVTRPPLPAVVTGLAYTGAVAGDVANLSARLSLDVLTDDWVKVPISLQDAAVSKVTGATLAAAGPGNYLLVLRGRGSREVALDLTAPVSRSPDRQTVSLKGPVAGSTSVELAIPEAGLEVEVSPKLASVQVQEEAGRTVIRAVLGATDQVSISWRAKSEMIAAQALAVASSRTEVVVADGVVHSHARIDYQLLRGELAELAFTMPARHRLLDVRVKGLRDWRTAAEEDRQRVTVRLYAPARGTIPLEVETEEPIPDGPFAVATIRAAGVERETGLISVRSGQEQSLSVRERVGVTRLEPGDVPKELAKPGALHYKFYSQDYRLAVQADAVAPRVHVESRYLARLEEGRLRVTVDLAYDIQRTGLFSVRIRLPGEVQLESVTSPALERYELGGPDGRLLTIHLARKTSGELRVILAYSQLRSDPAPGAGADLVLPIPEPVAEPEAAWVERGLVVLLAHESFEVAADPKRTRGVRPASPDELAGQGFVAPTEQHMSLAASYRYLAPPIEVAFSIKKRNTRLVADTITQVDVKETSIVTRTILQYEVQYAGTDTLELLVPESINERIEITGPNIKEKKSGPAQDGLVPWTVLLHTRTLGRHALTVTFLQPIDLQGAKEPAVQGDKEPSAESTVQLVRPAGVERENGEIAVFKDRQLALAAELENLEQIDPRQLTLLSAVPAESAKVADDAAQPEIQLAYRYYRHPTKLVLSITKHEIQRVVETVVQRALIEAVVPEDGPITYRARYQIKSSQRQRLAVALPKGAEFLDVTVAGRIVRPEKAGEQKDVETYLLNVSRTTSADTPFPMAIHYQIPRADSLARAGLWPFSMPALELWMPRFDGDVTFQRVFWQVWLPRRFTALGRPEGYTDENLPSLALAGGVAAGPQTHPEIAAWNQDWAQGSAAGVFEFPTVGHAFVYSSLVGQPQLVLDYGHVPTMVVGMSLAILLIMLVGVRWRGESKLTLLLLAALVVLLAALFAPESVYRWTAAGRYGIGFGLAFWLVGGWLRFRQQIAAARPERLEGAATSRPAANQDSPFESSAQESASPPPGDATEQRSQSPESPQEGAQP